MSFVRVGPSPIAGHGLFAGVDIPQDTRIIEYTGEKISTWESLRRLAQGNVYICRLNYRWAIDGQALETWPAISTIPVIPTVHRTRLRVTFG